MWTSDEGFEYPCDKCGKYTNDRELDYIRLTAEDFHNAMQYLPDDDDWSERLGALCVQCANEFDAVQHVIDNYDNPLPSGAMIPANFTIPPAEGLPSIAGYHNPLKRWNGWAMPYFDIESVKVIMEMNNELASAEPDTYDTFEITKAGVIWNYAGYEEDNIEVFESSKLHARDIYICNDDSIHNAGGNSSIEVWAIGAGCWVWDVENIQMTE